jgi:multiple sugar transport system substrate-binding protein
MKYKEVKAGGASVAHRGIRLVAAVVTVVTALTLSACGSPAPGPGESTTPSGDPLKGTITWEANPIGTSGPDPREVLIEQFEKKYPDIHVNLISAPNNTNTYQTALSTQISGGGGPDVYLGDVTWPAQFGAHQFAVPLSKYLPQSYFSGFAPGLVDGATYKDEVYAAPFYEDQGFLYYRKDILKADGLSVPTTWEDLVAAAQQAQRKGQVKYGFVFQGANYEGATCDFIEYLADAGGKVLSPDGKASALDSAAVTALTFQQSLVKSGVSPAAVSTYQEDQAMGAFQNGDALFMRNWDYAYATSQASGSAVVGKVGVAPLPTFRGQTGPGYSAIGGWNLYVNPHTENLAASLTFVTFMTGVDAQKTIATQFSLVPTNQAARTDPQVTGSSETLAVVPKTQLISRPSQSPAYPEISQAIYQAVNGVLAGSSEPAEAIKKAGTTIDAAIANGGL